jgi:ribulose-bisphosphate carboxylase large chain
MTIQELIQTLNSHQVAYINMDLKDPKNGDYMLACFHLIPGGKLNILQAACEVSAESSTGTNFAVQTETAYSRLLNALVYKIDLEKNLVWIAYPRRLFDR